MDLGNLLAQMRRDNAFAGIASNPRAQFGTPAREYLGASLLPERIVSDNAYTEDMIKYRTLLANDGTRYSPAQKKGSALVGSFDVKLAEQDIASEFTSRDYDTLIALLRRNASMESMAQIIRFLDVTINFALVEKIEKMRWEAITDAIVLLRGDNSYKEDVAYSNPAGHRVVVAGDWNSDAYDPFNDIFAMAQVLTNKGFKTTRIITSAKNIGILGANDKVKLRTNRVQVSTAGQIQSVSGRATRAQINAALAEDGLPPFETYDLRYRTVTGSSRFMDEDVMVFIGDTGESESVDLGDTTNEVLENVLGYVGIGRAAGQATPGRFIRAEHKEDKPPRIEAEGWQTSLPVIMEPEAIGVLSNIGL